MPNFLKAIIDEKSRPMQCAAIAALDWQMSIGGGSIILHQDAVPEELEPLLDSLQEDKTLQGYYGTSYKLYPPERRNAMQQALWETIFPLAEAKLKAKLAPLVDLPWHYGVTSSGDYHLWLSELDDEQRAAFEGIPQEAIEILERGDLFIGFRDDDVLLKLSRSRPGLHGHNILHSMVHDRIEAGIAREQEILAALPWYFDERGNMVLDAGVVDTLPEQNSGVLALPSGDTVPSSLLPMAVAPKSEIQSILERRNVKLENGFYILEAPNTVGKLWDSPDGDVDHARIAIHDAVREAALERNKPLMALPWRFDLQERTFVLREADLAASGRRESVEGALVKVGDHYTLYNLANYSYRATGAQEQVETFRNQLAELVPEDLDIADLADLPWQQDYEGLSVSRARFLQSDFAKRNRASLMDDKALIKIGGHDLKLELDYEGKVILRREVMEEFPYYVAVRRGLDKRHAQFVAEHDAQIAALPWQFSLRDSVSEYNAAILYAADMSAHERELADRLTEMNQLECIYNGDEYRLQGKQLAAQLQPHFDAWKPTEIATLAEMPWEHVQSALALRLANEHVNPRLAEKLRNAGIFQKGEYGYSFRDGREHSSTGYTDEVLNQLREAIAGKIRERTPIAELSEAILDLPWQYGGDYRGRAIVLDGAKVTPEQMQVVQAAIPEVKCMENFSLYDRDLFMGERHGYFELAEPGSHDIVRGVLEAPYYEALKPQAEKHLTRLIDQVAQFSWRANAIGGYELHKHDLSQEEQMLLRQIPGDYFDWDTQRAGHTEHSSLYAISPAAQDQRLMEAITACSRALTAR